MEPISIMCFWKYMVPKDPWAPYKKLWKLVETVRHNDQHFIDKPTSFTPNNTREPWDAWMNKKQIGDNYTPLLGRAITSWSVGDGVGLLDLHPPAFVPWLNVQFVPELKKLKNWYSFLEDGHTLFLGTCRAAEEMLFKDATALLPKG